MNENTMTIVGNLTDDPELRFTASGLAAAGFTVASTPRRFDRDAGEWRDGDTLFLRCSAWRELGEHCADSLSKGMRVVVTGRLRQSSWETADGEKRTSLQLDVDELGPSLRWATTQVTKTTSSNRTQTSGERSPWEVPPSQSQTTDQVPAAEPATAGAASQPPF